MSAYMRRRLRLSQISNCASPVSPSPFPVYFSSWSPMPVETPAEIFVAAILTMPLRKTALSREETVMPTSVSYTHLTLPTNREE